MVEEVPLGGRPNRTRRVSWRRAAGYGRDRLPQDVRTAPQATGQRLHLDAIAARRRNGHPELGENAAKDFLEKARAATRTEAPTVGRGTYRVLSGDVMGGELEDRSKPVHLSAFPLDEETRRDRRASDGPPVAPPSRRRHRR